MTENVAVPAPEARIGDPALQKVRALRAGVDAMRAAGESYLPKEELETSKDYQARLKRSWLFPALDKATRDMADKVFAKPIVLGKDVPPEIADLQKRISGDGQNLNSFARRVFEDGLDAGVSFIMVDSPRLNGTMTVAEQKARDFRPYLTMVRAEDVLGWKTFPNEPMERLSQIRIKETVIEEDPENEYGKVEVEQIRVLTVINGKVEVELHRKGLDGLDKGKWMIHDQFPVQMDEITIVPFYANRTGFFEGAVTLEKLADLNIAHWQSASDQRNILHKARVPVFFMKGMQADEAVIGANSALVSQSEHADAKWIEHNGAAIGAGRDDLQDLEMRMQVLGLELLIAKTGNHTATGEAIDAAKMTTPLAMMANSLEDALETALGYMAKYLGLADGGSLKVNTDFGVGLLRQVDLDFLLKSVNTGQISQETFLTEVKRRGVLMDDFSVDDEIERTEQEIPDAQDLAEVHLDDDPSVIAFNNALNGAA